MKKIFLGFSAMVTIAVVSCNSNHLSNDHNSGMNQGDMNMPMPNTTTADKDMKMAATTFTNVDPGVSMYMKTKIMDYLAVKHALADSKEPDAATASGKMIEAMKGFGKSQLSAEEQRVYNDFEDDLKEQAVHISKSNIDHQREHFAMMSKDRYEMVKAFGAGMTLYHDHCPMFKDGSMWLSETKDIKNPYYGEKMMTCGSTEEMMK